jgi:long-chain acyl-CoA synthetase
MLNLAILLEDSAREVPERTAVISGGNRLSYAQLQAATNQVARGLVERGIRKGDKVALSCPNISYFVIAYFGILKAGAVVVPLNVLLKPREIAYHLKDSDAKAYLCHQGTPELPMGEMGYTAFQEVEDCEHFFLMTNDPTAPSPMAGVKTLGELMRNQPTMFEMVMTEPDDTAVILYTSGTTGNPKGAELSHMNMLLNARLSETMYPKADDVHLITLPLFHSFGQSVQMNAGFYNRATLVLLPRFTPDVALRLMEEEKITFFAGVPTMYWALLNYPEADKFDLAKISRNLRICVSGGAAMPVEVMRAFNEKFQVKILEGYGLSETSPVATFNRLDREVKPGSVGLPVWGVEVRLVDQDDQEVVGPDELGEIAIRGHNIMKGYYKRPEATADAIRGGWFYSGDIGRRDEEGYFYIADRVKDMIIRGGFNVYPREIEEVLMTHPAVSLAAVVGIPHERHGEEVKAYIILKQGAELSEDELVIWSKQNMADYKYPRIIEFRTALPMTATGKILKRELR